MVWAQHIHAKIAEITGDSSATALQHPELTSHTAGTSEERGYVPQVLLPLVRMTSRVGSSAIAGYAIGMRIFVFVILPFWGLSGAAAKVVGQNFLGCVDVAFVVMPAAIIHIFNYRMGFAERELVRRGMVMQASLHRSEINPHGHLLCAMREVDGDGFGKVCEDWNKVEMLNALREAWADHVNAALENAGWAERVSHLSFKAQGIDRIPQPKIGVAASAMQTPGLETESHRRAAYVEMLNQSLQALRDIGVHGAVQHVGLGIAWEREQFLDADDFDELEHTRAENNHPPPPEDLPTGAWVRYIQQRRPEHRHEIT